MPAPKSSLPRVRHLRGRFAESMALMARREDVHARLLRTEEAAFDYVIAFDPTPKAIYLGTILRWLLSGQARLEDGRVIRDVLRRFHVGKHRLPQGARDIGRYGSPGEVVAILAEHPADIVSRMPEHVARHSRPVAEGDGWMIFAIDEVLSAHWWADGTAWCTRHLSRAAEYLRRGPLYVLVAGKDRWQLHVRERQWMDAYDHPVRMVPSSLPDEAIEAVLEIAGGPSPAGTNFRRVGVGMMAEDLLDMRRGRRKALRRIGPWPETPDWVSVEDGIGIYHDDVAERMATLHRTRDGLGRAQWDSLEQPSTVWVFVEGHGKKSIGVRELHSCSHEKKPHVDALLSFMCSGAARIADGKTDDGVHTLTGPNELTFLTRNLLRKEVLQELVMSDGQPYLVGLEEQDEVHEAMSIRDLRDGRRYEASDRWSWEGLPERVRRAVHVYHRQREVSGGLLMAVGPGLIGELAEDPIRLDEMRASFQFSLVKARDMIPVEAREVMQVLSMPEDVWLPPARR